jgi:hypothetical protein
MLVGSEQFQTGAEPYPRKPALRILAYAWAPGTHRLNYPDATTGELQNLGRGHTAVTPASVSGRLESIDLSLADERNDQRQMS